MSNSKEAKGFLVFAAGPVQGFVAQARRTRDLWAGSWLLSHLSEHALKAAEDGGGDAIVPYRGEEAGRVTSTRTPIGGYPNRFEVSFQDMAVAEKAGTDASRAFQERWERLAQEVWDQFIYEAAEKYGHSTREIWDRQIENFWELSWVAATTLVEARHLSAARKGFRNSPCPQEPGFKCSLMGSYQEISGHYGRKSAEKQRSFWSAVQAKTGLLDLAEGERLCAISLVKRLFPKVLTDLRDLVAWPSNSFVAARPWLEKLRGEDLELAQSYSKMVGKKVGRSEQPAAKNSKIPWADVDATAWYDEGLARNEWDESSETIQGWRQDLREITEKAGSPLPFYSILVMDGDSLGKLLSKLKNPSVLSQALKRFSEEVDKVVQEFKGWTVYAGGDDVLALLPAETSLRAADALAKTYRECFKDTNAKDSATLSGALLYVPLRMPIRPLLRFGHKLLDDVAKEKTGRDSLAIAVFLGSGLSAQWAAPWSVIRTGPPNAATGLSDLLARFASDDQDSQKLPNFNASFLYGMRDTLARLFALPYVGPGEFSRIDLEKKELLTDLVHAEYRRRLSGENASMTPASDSREKIVEELIWLSQRWWREDGEPKYDGNEFTFDGWRVARFLQQVNEGEVTV